VGRPRFQHSSMFGDYQVAEEQVLPPPFAQAREIVPVAESLLIEKIRPLFDVAVIV